MLGYTKKVPDMKTTTQSENDEVLDKKILEVLSNRGYKARTIKGIANQIQQNEGVVVARLRTPKLREQIKVYPRRSKRGDILITTKKHFEEDASMFDKAIDIFGSKHLGLDDVN